MNRLTTAWSALLATVFDTVFDTVFAAVSVRVRDDRERGDIPGWVMIAIMSAAVVVVLIPLVSSTVSDAFTNAIKSVTGSG